MLWLSSLYVLAGGFVGTICRFEIARGCKSIDTDGFILATLIYNIVGCLIAGLLIPFSKHPGFWTHLLPLISVGFCGSLTSFGTYAEEIVTHFRQKRIGLGIGEIVAMIFACFLFVYIGFILSKLFILPCFPLPEEKKEESSSQEDKVEDVDNKGKNDTEEL